MNSLQKSGMSESEAYHVRDESNDRFDDLDEYQTGMGLSFHEYINYQSFREFIIAKYQKVIYE